MICGGEAIISMKEHEGLDGAVETLERVMPCLMRRLFFDLTADSPLWELPLPQLKLLGMLERRDNRRMSEIGERLGVALSTVTQVADRLEQRGWVRRVDDPGDRRVVRLALTDAGRRLMGERREARRGRLLMLLSSLEPEERGRVVGAVEALYRAARRLEIGGPPPGKPAPGPDSALWELLQGLEPATAEEERLPRR
jgi:DNA-binding MarR family transcriptional regulator